ncbi:MAG: ABC transporter permease [Gammaproteobacteria bacterium]
MNTTAMRTWTWRDTLGVYLREAGYQFWKNLRMPGFVLPTLAFPTMFYLFFGLLFGHSNGINMAAYLLATYGTFGIMSPALFGFGVGVAMERERGSLALKRVAPMPPMAYMLAKAVMAMLFAMIIAVLLFSLGALFGHVVLPHHIWLTLAAVLMFGTIPFCALGLTVGLSVGGQSSAAIINLIYLPMSFLSGLWIPIKFMPHFLQVFAQLLPAYHLAQIALGTIGMGDGGQLAWHLIYLLVFSAACLRIAQISWHRIQDR